MPDLPFLGKASLRDFETLFEAELLAGHDFRGLHYGVDDAFLVTTGLRRFLRRAFEQREQSWRRPLFVTHVTRDDVVLGFLSHFQKMMAQQSGARGPQRTRSDRRAPRVHAYVHAYTRACLHACTGRVDRQHDWAGAMILSVGASTAWPDLEPIREEQSMLPYLETMIQQVNAPVLLTRAGTLDVLEKVKSYKAKHNIGDEPRVKAAIEHYRQHIDFDRMLA